MTDHLLLYEILAAHRREIVEACEKAIGREHREQLARYADVFFEQMLGVLAASQEEEGNRPGSNGEQASERVKLEAGSLVGTSAPMRRTRLAIEQLARRSRAAVLLVGEFGTGKRHSARALHAATFPDGEFFELNPERATELEQRISLLRSRASARALAGLTVYVHELTEIPALLQLELSKLLSEQGLHFRLIVSSKRALAQAAREGLVRSELAFCFPNQLELPALRDRLEDIAELAAHFAELAASARGSSPIVLGPSALARMREHAWPGNLAELSNLIEQLSQTSGPALVEADDLPELDERTSGINFHLPADGIDFRELERELLTQALVMAGNNQTRAASLLGLSRDQLRYRLAKFDISANSARS